MREPTSNIQNGLLKCNLDKTNHSLFFSLVDYRNNLFTGNDPTKIMEFYDGFENRDQLIQWMKERPKGVSYIHEVDGDKDIIVVIPTADFNGKYARECRDNIFKGLHMVFVESGGKGNFYFNYAHNCNVGIKKAMEYNPKWVVVSNDDMYKIDSINILITELSEISMSDVAVVFSSNPVRWHSYKIAITYDKSIVHDLYNLILELISGNILYQRIKENIRKSYNVKLKHINCLSPLDKIIRKVLFRNAKCFLNIGDFSIFSGNFISMREGSLFDETYINGVEDFDLSYSLYTNNNKYKFIDYTIRSPGGASLGGAKSGRWIRDIVNVIYFDCKLHQENCG